VHFHHSRYKKNVSEQVLGENICITKFFGGMAISPRFRNSMLRANECRKILLFNGAVT
jgi:hypothetical protein